ncbi:MAG: NAD(P)-dependent alcohol dehydrogenase [Chloroflexota bacterium]|nr:NAD(P)-dependent alcohol dehydrogenase [Chloroflexota bacterium]
MGASADRETMRAIVWPRYGPPDVLRFADVPKPEPTNDQVLVRVAAASLNRADLDYLRGWPLLGRLFTGLRRPRTGRLGLDVAGRVEAIGGDVTRFQPGDEVYGNMTAYGFGAFAEYVCAREKAFAMKPATMTMETAATIPEAAIVAIQGLRLRGGRTIKPGDKVLVNGASGSVGPWAVQIAKSLGTEVTGVSRTEKMEFVRSIGADHVIDYTGEQFPPRAKRYDWILDIAGKDSIRDWRRALSPTGVYVVVGGTIPRMLQALVMGPLLSRSGKQTVAIMTWWKPFKREDVAALEKLVADGKIAPAIDRRYPLREVPEALMYVDAGHAKGKVVITM